MKDYVSEMVANFSWPQWFWWHIWHKRLYWWLSYMRDWVLDKPWWCFDKEEPYLRTLRTKKEVDDAG